MPSSPSQYAEKYGHISSSAGGSSSRGGRKSGLRSRTTQLMALRFGWVVVVIWFEVGEFFHSLSSCKFPDSPLRPYTAPGSTPAHIVLVADPHVPHPILSHPEDAFGWMNSLRQAFDELFMRKSWNVVMRLGRIDGVIMLGDMLDTGRGLMSDEEYEEYYDLYASIFTLPSDTPIYHVPGNHDIPLGPYKLFSPHARERYARHFTQPNDVISIANHSIVLLDSVSLVEEDYRRYASEMQFGEWDGVEGGVIEFVKSVGDQKLTNPRILISHIPLARPEGAKCGPYREHGRIQKGAGPGYQNLLGSETSRFLLDELQPSIVFSGDDHDYCEYTHSGRTREVTLKSFSTSTGIRRPGFQLLSLVPPAHPGAAYSHQPTLADRPCFLPDQAGVYTRVYLPLVIVTVAFLFGTNVRNAYKRWAGMGFGDKWEKYRLSPNLGGGSESGFGQGYGQGQFRRTSDRDKEKGDRPVPLTLPSRKSSGHLATSAAMTSGASTGSASRGVWRVTSRTNMGSPDFNANAGGSGNGYNRSVSPSPYGSPRPSFSTDRYYENNDDVSTLPSPALSRRSSFIYMNSSRDAERGSERERVEGKEGVGDKLLSAEPPSYFLPLPSPSALSPSSVGPGSGIGLGFSTPGGAGSSSSAHSNSHAYGNAHGYGSQPNSPLWRRTSHTNLHAPVLVAPHPQRRVTMPRLPSFITGSSSNDNNMSLPLSAGGNGRRGTTPTPSPMHSTFSQAYAQPQGAGVPVLSLEHSVYAGQGPWGAVLSAVDNVRLVLRWVWRVRESVMGRSAREVWAVFWVAGVVWVGVNALFFWG